MLRATKTQRNIMIGTVVGMGAFGAFMQYYGNSSELEDLIKKSEAQREFRNSVRMTTEDEWKRMKEWQGRQNDPRWGNVR
jgi:predicted RNA-binding protein with RPS1 domain